MSDNDKDKVVSKRAYALDALRGYAILTMVLSAMVAERVLPGWMYHTQTPPPDHVYNPVLTGLTWVDLVFPFFLFAMGAAFPFSIKRKFERGMSKWTLAFDAVKRGIQLVFFAIFLQHFYPYMLDAPQNYRSWFLAILCFMVLFPMFMRIPIKMPSWAHTTIKLAAYAVAALMMLLTKHADGTTLNLYSSNIIILLLANMALFASLLYIVTIHKPLVRLMVLLPLMAFMLSATIDGSWTKIVFQYSPIGWMFHFDYLKYLFIVIPGSIAGEVLLAWMSKSSDFDKHKDEERIAWQSSILVFLTLAIIVCNLVGLYTHSYVTDLLVTLILLAIGRFTLHKTSGTGLLWKKLFTYGSYLLILGLLFEPFQGGIKKDPATFSYFFVTSGLAFMALIFFHIVCDFYHCHRGTKFLVMSGQNPMIAYVAGDLLIMPLFNIIGVFPFIISFCGASPWLGFMQGIFFTTLSVLVTMFFTKIKWFWRT